MIRNLLTSVLLTLALLFAFVAAPQTVSAKILDAGCTGAAAASAVCQDGKNGGADPLTGNHGAILTVANVLASVAGVAAVIIIIVSGIKFISSGGEAQAVATARRSIIYASIGLVIIILARSIISLVLANI